MISSVFDILTTYLGGWGTSILSTILFIIIVRIGIAFVFKIFRLNIDYHNTWSSTKTLYQHTKIK